jgi:micrococcal nuclease
MNLSLRIKRKFIGLILMALSFVLLSVAHYYLFPNTFYTDAATYQRELEDAKTRPHPAGAWNVVTVIDGDTIIIWRGEKEETIRMIGLNTPETVDPRKPAQCYGREASDEAKRLLEKSYIILETDPSQDVLDKYGRTLGYVILADGRNFGLVMIENGFAFEYTYQRKYKYQSEFRAAQAEAKSGQIGIWSPDACGGKLIPAS